MLRESIFTKLCNINRFSNLHFIERDTDSDHTIRMQLYIMQLYNELGSIIPYKELCYRILVHDLDEIVMCDIPRPIKYYSEEISKALQEVSRELLHKSGIKSEIIEDISTAKSKDEWGLIIKYLDIYDALCTLINEWKLQKKNVLYESIEKSLGYLADITSVILDSKLPDQVKSYLELEFKEILKEV